MSNIKGRFADQDSYVLSQTVLTADNNAASFHVAITETDHLRATPASLQPNALTMNIANPIPDVTIAGANTIGAALGDVGQEIAVIGQTGTGSEGDPGNCFLGNTQFTLWREPFSTHRRTMPFRWLYEDFHRKIGIDKEHTEYLKTLEWFAFSYDENNYPVKGRILNVFQTVVYEYLNVTFQEKRIAEYSTGVVLEHRYFTPEGEYVPIKDLLGKRVVHEEKWREPFVYAIDEIQAPNGILVYNAEIETYQNYCADGLRVHNIKPERSGIADQ